MAHLIPGDTSPASRQAVEASTSLPHRIETHSPLLVTALNGPEVAGTLAFDTADAALLSVPRTLPPCGLTASARAALGLLERQIAAIAAQLPADAELVLYGDPLDLAYLRRVLPAGFHEHLWVAVRTEVGSTDGTLPSEHRSLLFFGKDESRLRHARVRVGYQFCPACDRTTKDYGGRKHLYDAYGTLLSDVWKDEVADPADPLPAWVVERIAGLLSSHGRREMVTLDLGPQLPPMCEALWSAVVSTAFPSESAPGLSKGELGATTDTKAVETTALQSASHPAAGTICPNSTAPGAKIWRCPAGELINDDALATLRALDSNSVDLAFADPPYNLAKRYAASGDRHAADQYLAWCDAWLAEYVRLVRPGGVVAVLNLPAWCAEHALTLHRDLEFMNWVAWESMSLPAREIMPSHYTLLLFRKPAGQPGGEVRGTREVGEWRSGGVGPDRSPDSATSPLPHFPTSPDLAALRHGYCLRPGCRRQRDPAAATAPVTDLWTDIHRVKHNSLRWDHPCQLPPRFMRRVIAATTRPGNVVLDAFNGIGTTTLVAQQMGRRFVGIELSAEYFRVARERHHTLLAGGDPFARRDRAPAVKNNAVRRQPRRTYEVPKKTIQLAVRELALRLERMPTRADALAHLPYPEPIYREYFKSWSEVLAAARTTGMSERRPE